MVCFGGAGLAALSPWARISNVDASRRDDAMAGPMSAYNSTIPQFQIALSLLVNVRVVE